METRRTFLTRLTALSVSASVAHPYVIAADRTGRRLPVVGAGEHTYECLHDWLQPPEGLVWGNTHAVCQDAAGLIYIAHTVHESSRRAETVVVFDARGRFVRAFGSEFRGGAHGLDIRREPEGEFLYLCDTTRSVIVKMSLTGEYVWEQGYPHDDPAYAGKDLKFRPTNVAFAPNGDVFIGDGYGSSRMLRFTSGGKFLGELASPGSGPGELRGPHGQWVDLRGHEPVLVVADRTNRRLQVFSLDGRHLRTVQDETRLRMPCHFDVRGEWMVCPDLDSQVCLLDRDYRVVAQLGDGQAANGKVGSRRVQSRADFTPGQFICPHDAAFLQNGDILVAEWLPIGRLTLLRRVAA